MLKPNQSLLISNEEDYNKARHLLRNPSAEYEGPYPIYFEYIESAFFGKSVGYNTGVPNHQVVRID